MVCEFPDMLPPDLPDLPIKRDVDFALDLEAKN